MSTELHRIRDIMNTAIKRRAAEESEQVQRGIAEFAAKYESEFEKKIEKAAAKGRSNCILTGFSSSAALRVGVREFIALGFGAQQYHSVGCIESSCHCEAWSLSVSWVGGRLE